MKQLEDLTLQQLEVIALDLSCPKVEVDSITDDDNLGYEQIKLALIDLIRSDSQPMQSAEF